MRPDHHTLEEALRELAQHARQVSRLAAVSEVRRRGDTLRRRRQIATAALGVSLLGMLGVGAAAAHLTRAPHATLPVGPPGPTGSAPAHSPDVRPTGPTPSPPTHSPDMQPAGTDPSSPADPPEAAPTDITPSAPVTSASADPLRLGQRQFAVVRSSAWESAVSLLDDGRLAEVDGDDGRSLFVFVPQASGTHLVRTAEPDADGTRHCWQVQAAGSGPLAIVAAPCSPADPRQQFSIEPRGQDGDKPTYAISNRSAYLQHSSQRGLILEELGDAPLTTVFRFVDNGPAPH
ncbi:hypothetical protein C5N14_30300 [Micromonospora sp. MW-13]|uniref:hypothetical protein n=1 Tax=unclassified Micromonospora TaxID=2617518 RepID=UPI000E43ABF3|nr:MULTISPECIES: hypothetical protein [unclassified Micromonospora]MCX4469479.1 hypothetical protein [Micromonospora sp. NBC_01655]RGC65152.1 hypothetical protein C5N14_30300 [Micromonospora sp. MW-13]